MKLVLKNKAVPSDAKSCVQWFFPIWYIPYYAIPIMTPPSVPSRPIPSVLFQPICEENGKVVLVYTIGLSCTSSLPLLGPPLPTT